MKIERRTQMRNGTVADDPRLGRLIQFDERSRRFDIYDKLEDVGWPQLRGRTWKIPMLLDQGETSACTGNSRTYDMAGSPVPLKQPDGSMLDESFAQRLYQLAKKNDEWPGEDYEGSSVLGALKAAKKLGYVGEYRWAFDIDDMMLAISHLGPVVVGTNWYDSMFEPQPNGVLEVDPSSSIAGGHAYIFNRVVVSNDIKRTVLGRGVPLRRGTPLLGGVNSWGQHWGVAGRFYIWSDDYANILMNDGEQSVVTQALHVDTTHA